MTLSPNTGSVNIGSNFTVTVRENSGVEAVNAVEADLNYDQTKLQYISADTSGSPFGIGPAPTGGSGTVSIIKGSASSQTGDQVVATITFKSLAATTGTPITFANTSAIVRTSDAADIWNGSSVGGTYTTSIPVYRLANYITRERLFTTDLNEKNYINGRNGWVYEAIAFNAAGNGTIPVYRLANYITRERLFTTDLNEKNYINGRNGWVYESIAFNAVPTGSIPVYRLANYITHERLFTIDGNEKNYINGHNGWVYETIAFYQN